MTEALSSSELDAIVDRYLAELAGALRRLPASARDHLVSDIREHIGDLRAERPVRDRSDMEALLNRVGLPEDIAAVALEGEEDPGEPEAETGAPASAIPPARAGWRLTVTKRVALVGASGLVVFALLVAGLAGAFSSNQRFVVPFALVRSSSIAAPAIRIGPIVPGAAPGGGRVLVTVPNVIGESETAAEETLIGAGLPYVVQTNSSATVPSGTVIAQVPAAGSSMVRQQSALIIVSSGPATATG